MKNFIFYWLTGDIDKGQGTDVADAFRRLGYGGGAMNALDFYDQNENQEYNWDKEQKRWEKISA